MIEVEAVSETCLIVYFAEPFDLQTTDQFTPRIIRLSHALERELGEYLVEIIPSYTSILLQYQPRKIGYDALVRLIMDRIKEPGGTTRLDSVKPITLPVYYHDEVGPDLKALAAGHNLTEQQVIDLHSQHSYTICAIGFAPGFAFLAPVAAEIATPRHPQPRQTVPAGSVGIANRQTAVYPDDSPGGWQIIGNCPVALFSADASPMSPFAVGGTVRFKAIARPEFLRLGGKIWPDWK